MSSHSATTSDSSHSRELDTQEGYRTYHTGNAEDLYIEGYDPSSLGAQHSSLLKTSTWLGMGLFMVAIAFFGVLLWALAQLIWGTGSVDHDPMLFVLIGGIGGVVTMALAFFLMLVVGRKDYKEYTRRTGRMN